MPLKKDITARIPVSTYRLQFNRHFRFSDAKAIVSYLHTLGISDIYSSPYLKAREGSLHGYDIVDHSMLNPEIGSEEEYAGLIDEIRRHGMGQRGFICRSALYVFLHSRRKYLGKGERMPDDWPIFSTTGYAFLNILNGIFVDTANARDLDEIYTKFIKSNINLNEIIYDKKKLIMQAAMSSEVRTLIMIQRGVRI